MSASLVGSEMCIRDSCNPGLPGQVAALGVAGDVPRAAAAGPGIVGWNQPVSYTHLTLPTICSV
eukprot:3769772-Alexandrium_andersonii.AAC.1